MDLIYDSSNFLNISINRIITNKSEMKEVSNNIVFSDNVNFEDLFLNDSYLLNAKENKYEFKKSITDEISIDDLEGITEGFISYNIVVSSNGDTGFTGIYNNIGNELEKMTSFGSSDFLIFDVTNNKIGLEKA